MKRLLFLFSFVFLCAWTYSGFSATISGKASPQAVVGVGDDVRFTILTSGLVRMEWAPDGSFNDDPSFVAVNRELPAPAFKKAKKGKWTVIATDRMEIRYLTGSGKFTPENLIVKSPSRKGFQFEWRPGKQQEHNLKGTYRTLDGYDGDTRRDGSKMPVEDGLLARDGWTFIDDSGSFLFDDSPWPWVKRRAEGDAQDWYFMAYGSDYKAALKDFTLISGKMPLPPRYAFGYWWSRYWAYSDTEIRGIVENMEKYDIPLDVFVIDMDWHLTDSVGTKDEFGQSKYWTGWTWNRDLFPAPEKLLGWLGDRNIKKTLNLHPASGIADFESQYEEMGRRMGFDTSTRRNIPWVVSDKKFMETMFDVVLHPMERQGVDFWWLDWQQWPYDKQMDGLSNTWWLNYVFFTDMERNRDARPMLYHRWGGLGNHRYQIGFSGDAIITWNSLEFQPYFTNCASNVLYGYWSHDLGGHMFMAGQERVLDPELYARWMQYGVFSPIFRTHSTKDATINKEFWNFRGEYFDALTEAVKLRYELVPYIYTAARQSYETGVSICRPMYYDYPANEESYAFSRQYMFGDDMLIAPIGAPMQDGVSTVKVWLPAGNDWFEWNTGTLLKGGRTVERMFTLDEYPVYIKAGAVIPMYDGTVRNLASQPSAVNIAVFPGAAGSGVMYEDNGNDKNYSTDHAWTRFSTEITGKNNLRMTIFPREGGYEGMPETRDYAVHIYGSAMPASVTVNGRPADYSYVGSSLRLDVDLGERRCDGQYVVEVVYPDGTPELNDGLTARFKKASRAATELKSLIAHARGPIPAAISSAAETSIMLEYFPERFNELIMKFNECYLAAPGIIGELDIPEDRKAYWTGVLSE